MEILYKKKLQLMKLDDEDVLLVEQTKIVCHLNYSEKEVPQRTKETMRSFFVSTRQLTLFEIDANSSENSEIIFYFCVISGYFAYF